MLRTQPPKNTHTHNAAKPQTIISYKPTLVYDPLKSETYRILHEQGAANANGLPQNVPLAAVQPKVYQPNRLIPGKVRSPESMFIAVSYLSAECVCVCISILQKQPTNPVSNPHPFKNVSDSRAMHPLEYINPSVACR